MKERILNVIKTFLIILGILFLIQFFLILGAIIGLVNFSNFDFKSNKSFDIKEINPVVKYIENYKETNGVYPQNINELKLNKNFEYKYELSKNNDCYSIKIKSKKNSINKSYQHCASQDDNSSSYSEVYTYSE